MTERPQLRLGAFMRPVSIHPRGGVICFATSRVVWTILSTWPFRSHSVTACSGRSTKVGVA